jgi:hypothetical protein
VKEFNNPIGWSILTGGNMSSARRFLAIGIFDQK